MNHHGRQQDAVGRAVVETALGRFEIEASARGLTSVTPADATAARAEAPRGAVLAGAAEALVAYAAGARAGYRGALDLRGTAFQRRVWDAAREIPFGTRVSYGALAARLGMPHAARAVGAALAANPIAVLVPCHRVLDARGGARGYAWGIALKQRLLAHEGASVNPRAGPGAAPLAHACTTRKRRGAALHPAPKRILGLCVEDCRCERSGSRSPDALRPTPRSAARGGGCGRAGGW